MVFSIVLIVLAVIVIGGAVLVVKNSGGGGGASSDNNFPTPTSLGSVTASVTGSTTGTAAALNANCRKLQTFWLQYAQISANGGTVPPGTVLPTGKAMATCSGTVTPSIATVSGPVVALTYKATAASATAYAHALAAGGWKQGAASAQAVLWTSTKYPKLRIETQLDGTTLIQVLVAGPLTVQ
jgi:hypothetical protein